MDRTDSRLAHSPGPASDDAASPFNANPDGAEPAGPAPPGESPAEERAYWRGVADGLTRAGSPVPPEIARRAAAPAPGAAPAGEPLPWEGEPPEEPAPRRHDAFSGAKKQLYLKALAKHGCIVDACRVTGVSSSTVYNHQASDPEFARNCNLALSMASTPIELTAYERAVVGIEEDVIRGGKVVGTRVRRSDYMLRVLLQGSDPKKYGPRPGFTRKRLLRFERRQMEREIAGRLAAEARGGRERRDGAAVFEELAARLAEIKSEKSELRRAAGWTELGRDISVPPGWVWAGQGDPAEQLAEDLKNLDAVCNSSKSSTLDAAKEAGAGAPAEFRPAEPFPGLPHSLDSAATGDDHGR